MLALAALISAAFLAARPSHAAALHRAALVIEHASGRVISRCVGFAEEQITGLQLIQRAGIEYQTQDFGPMGSAVCQLDSEPSPVPGNCLGTGPYWQYFHRTPNGWAQSQLGASSSMLHDGDMDGWHYASGVAQAPPNVSFGSVCAAPATPASSISPTRAAAAALPRASAVERPSSAAPVPPSNLPSGAAPLVAQALTPSATAKAALPETGPSTPSRPGPRLATWIFLGASATILLAIAGFNLRRRRP